MTENERKRFEALVFALFFTGLIVYFFFFNKIIWGIVAIGVSLGQWYGFYELGCIIRHERENKNKENKDEENKSL